jgi:hypothetical protein
MLARRILAGLTLVLAAAMLLLSLAGAVGVWVVKGPVTARATHVFARIDAGLDVAEQNLGPAAASLARAQEHLNEAREEQRKIAQEPQRPSALRRLVAQRVEQTVSPQAGDAREKVQTVAEAAVVVNSVLEDVGTIPLLSTSGLDVDRIKEVNTRLAEVGPAAWELSRLAEEPEGPPDAGAVDHQMSRIDQALKTARGSVAEYQSRVAEARQRTGELKARTLAWITPAAVLISAVCFWVALSQVSLLAHAWGWWKR